MRGGVFDAVEALKSLLASLQGCCVLLEEWWTLRGTQLLLQKTFSDFPSSFTRQ